MLETARLAVRPHDLALDSLVARLRDAALVADLDTGRIRIWNGAAASLFGYEPEEALGMRLTGLIPDAGGPPHAGAPTLGAWVLERGMIAQGPFECTAQHKDGRAFIVELTVSPLGAVDGAAGKALAIVRDVTERRYLSDVRDGFVNVVSHELRTPISTILGFGGLLLEDLAGALSAEQRHYLERMVACADDLRDLVDDLLDMSQLQAGKFLLHCQAFDFRALVVEVCQALTPMLAEKRLTLQDEVPEGLGAIHGDRKRVAQVLRNLLGNAIKFTPTGGRIVLRAERAGHGLLVEVEDTGPGIPLQEQPKLFQPFMRLGDGTLPGTGLGLCISRALIEAHQGMLSIRPQVPGAVFWFTLPLG